MSEPEYSIKTTDEERFRQHLNGPDLHCAIWEFANKLRDAAKHGEGVEAEQAARWQKALFDELESEGIDLWR